MKCVREEALPLVAMSHQFIGAEQGDVKISIYFFRAVSGKGPQRHRYPYDKVVQVRERRARWTVDGREVEVGPGEIFVVKTGEIHTFVSIGDVLQVQGHIHLAPPFEQENLD